MYPFCDFTTNPLMGKCPHDCLYCYMKDLKMYPEIRRKYSGAIRISWKDLKTPTGKHRVRRRINLPFVPTDRLVIFVCSGHDLGVASYNIKVQILKACWEQPQHFYLIQSKNPAGLKEVEDYLPPNTIIGTTLETNREYIIRKVSKAPLPQQRVSGLNLFDARRYWKMISVEPKMMCDPQPFADLIRKAEPNFVSVGADRGGRHKLPEPDTKTLLDFIRLIEKFTFVIKKENLTRLIKKSESGKAEEWYSHKIE